MNIEIFTDRVNLALGILAALFSYVFGEHWILFAFFLLLNCGDFLTRWIAARLTETENSKAGWLGILKKLGYWVMIALGFGMSVVFIEIGMVIHVNLEVTTFIGWFVLATLIINEIRSILENLIEAGYQVPNVLIKGLEVANKAIDGEIKIGDDGIETVLNKTKEEIKTKGKATFEVKDHRTNTS